MEDVVSLVNKLQDVFSTVGPKGGLSIQDIQLPQIVVIGMQSSGKSSVLESLVGESFLPRGEGAVTRCPISLQLVQRLKAPNESGSRKWCEFLHKRGQIYDNFKEVEKELRKETDRLAGTNSGIVNKPIRLTIYSPDVVNLTVVDLPGIVKIPSGDQPKDIEQQIHKMLRVYAMNPNSIILAVSPANNDLPTSESLALAKEVDPHGDRTLGVITKLDLMDQGSTYAWNMLSGKIIPVKLGIIGVVNRSQQENVNNKTVAQALEDETKFLNKTYRKLAHRNGTKFLAKTLSDILKTHIYKCLPNLERRLIEMRTSAQEEFDDLRIIELPEDKSQTILEVIQNFCDAYKAEIFGKSRDMDISRLYTKARMSFVFRETFALDMQTIDPIRDITNEEISNAILNSRSLESDLFLPEDAFQHLVRHQIRRMEEPSIRCAELIDGVMVEAIQNSLSSAQVSKFISIFPKLGDAIVDLSQDLHRERMKSAKEKIKEHIDILATFVKTFDDQFIKTQIELTQNLDVGQPVIDQARVLNGKNDLIAFGVKGTFSVSGNSKSNVADTDEEDELSNWKPPAGKSSGSDKSDEKIGNEKKYKAVRKLVYQYFQLQRKGLQDYVPRVIAHAVIYDTERKIQTYLTHQLHNKVKAEELLIVPELLRLQRERLEGNIEKLENGIKFIRECRSCG